MLVLNWNRLAALQLFPRELSFCRFDGVQNIVVAHRGPQVDRRKEGWSWWLALPISTRQGTSYLRRQLVMILGRGYRAGLIDWVTNFAQCLSSILFQRLCSKGLSHFYFFIEALDLELKSLNVVSRGLGQCFSTPDAFFKHLNLIL